MTGWYRRGISTCRVKCISHLPLPHGRVARICIQNVVKGITCQICWWKCAHRIGFAFFKATTYHLGDKDHAQQEGTRSQYNRLLEPHLECDECIREMSWKLGCKGEDVTARGRWPTMIDRHATKRANTGLAYRFPTLRNNSMYWKAWLFVHLHSLLHSVLSVWYSVQISVIRTNITYGMLVWRILDPCMGTGHC